MVQNNDFGFAAPPHPSGSLGNWFDLLIVSMGAADLWALNSADIFAAWTSSRQTLLWIQLVPRGAWKSCFPPKESQSNFSSFRCFVIRLLCGFSVLQMRPQGSFPQDSGNEMEMKVLVIAHPKIPEVKMQFFYLNWLPLGDTTLCLMT